MPEAPRRPGQEPESGRDSRPWVSALGAGTELAAAVLAGFGIGYWLDARLRTSPWLAVLGAMAGMALALYRLIQVSRIHPGGH